MLFTVVLILLLVWRYKKKDSYNPYDTSYSHSSYYEAAFCQMEDCTDEVCRILGETAGARGLFRNPRFVQGQDKGRAGTVVLVHESGIYVISSFNLEGSITGNPMGRYWEQTFGGRRLTAYRNFFYNPFLQNKKCLDQIQWTLRDMPALPCYSLAVFGSKGALWTNGDMGDNRWAVPLHGLSAAVAQIMRNNRKRFSAQQVEQICARLGAEGEA